MNYLNYWRNFLKVVLYNLYNSRYNRLFIYIYNRTNIFQEFRRVYIDIILFSDLFLGFKYHFFLLTNSEFINQFSKIHILYRIFFLHEIICIYMFSWIMILHLKVFSTTCKLTDNLDNLKFLTFLH